MITLKKGASVLFYGLSAALILMLLYLELSPNTYVSITSKLIVLSISFSFLILGTIMRYRFLEKPEHKTMAIKIAFFVPFFVYIIFLIYLLFFDRGFGRFPFAFLNTDMPYSRGLSYYFENHTNFIPLKTIKLYINEIFRNIRFDPSIDGIIQSHAIKFALTNLFGNLAAFSPMGLFLPTFFQKMRNIKVFIIFMIGTLVLVEFIQFFALTGSCDIDDILLNSVGALLMFSITKLKIVQKLFVAWGFR